MQTRIFQQLPHLLLAPVVEYQQDVDEGAGPNSASSLSFFTNWRHRSNQVGFFVKIFDLTWPMTLIQAELDLLDQCSVLRL
jgi:hypothetical protein